MPQWMPTLGIEGGRINMVPVDYVADAMDHIAHKAGLDGHCFHLTDPAPRASARCSTLFARAGHAPQMTMRIDARMFAFVPRDAHGGDQPAAGEALHGMLLRDLGIPREVLKFITYPTRFDNRETERALKGSKITVPCAGGLRVAVVGLLGAPPRPGTVRRPQPERARSAARWW
jgi:hypothetical protein